MKIVLTTAPDEKSARQIAKEIIELKLAACVNIIPKITSIYIWEGKVKEDKEVIMLIKTTKSRLKKLEEEILSLHPYDTPEFISLDIEHANRKFEAWVHKAAIG
jgi:periplasmic divalent cation tolerance protein